jgi:hypothetical protein
MTTGPTRQRVLLGVSIPRSGHHFLAALLEHALGADLRYCEYYSEKDCCRQVPCARSHGCPVSYQKNHDLDLTLDPALPDVSYVVQYRDPVPAIVSDRELFAAVRGPQLADDKAHYHAFLAEKAAHYTKFYEKWIRRPGPATFVIKYERLVQDPAGVMAELFAFCGLPESPAGIAAAVAEVAPVLNRTPILGERARTGFAPRVVTRSRYFDAELLAIYESMVLDRVPELRPSRTLPPAEYRNHPLFALFTIQCARLDGQLDEVARLAQDAARAWPDHLYVNYVAGDALRDCGRYVDALPLLETAVRLAPHDAAVIVSCANAHIALQHLPQASDLAAQLVALAPQDASHRLFLATILMMAGRPAEALHQALKALEIGIGEPHLWRAFGNVVQEARRAGWRLQPASGHSPG